MIRRLGNEQYGLWVAMLSIVSIAGVVDFGLGWTVMREVASGLVGRESLERSNFIDAARTGFVVLGAGAILVAVLGVTAARWMPISRQSAYTVSLMFALGGIGFLANSLTGFARAVLQGHRRFDLVTFVSALSAIVWGAAVFIVLRAGGKLIPVALAYTGGGDRDRADRDGFGATAHRLRENPCNKCAQVHEPE